MPELTLVSHKLCPYVQRAAIALAEKDVRFERVDIDLADKPDWFQSISPLGKVPLLRVRDGAAREAVLFESNVICEYIEDALPAVRLHPEDALERARHRAWMEFGSAVLSDLWDIETTKDVSLFEAKRGAVQTKFGFVETALADGPFFAGGRFSLVDAVFAPIFRYFDLFDTLTDLRVFDRTPKTSAWRSALAARPSVRGAVGPTYPTLLHDFLRSHDAYLLRRERKAA